MGNKRINTITIDETWLWAATESGLFKYNFVNQDTLIPDKVYDTSLGLPDSWCYDVKRCKKGMVWVATKKGIAKLNDQGKFEKVTQIPEVRCLKLFFDHRNHLWIGTNQGLLYFNGKELIPFKEETGLLANDINCFYEDDKKQLWIGSSKGLTIIDNTLPVTFAQAPQLLAKCA